MHDMHRTDIKVYFSLPQMLAMTFGSKPSPYFKDKTEVTMKLHIKMILLTVSGSKALLISFKYEFKL